MTRARSASISAGLLFSLLAIAGPARAQLTGTTSQLTTNPATQLDPAISGDLVVFTDLRNGNEDVYYVDVSTMTEVRVTTNSANQRLNDVDGSLIVYTDLSAPGDHINAFDVTSASTTTLTSGPIDRNPRIAGATAVFERGPSGSVDVYAVDVASLAVSPVATSAANELNPVVSGTRVVYERHATASSPGEIVVFDLATSSETVLGQPTLDDKRPDIDGDLVVWDVVTPAGDTDVMIHDLSTGLGKTLTLAGNQRAPHVSGRVAAFDDDSSGTSDVLVHHVDLLLTATVGGGPGTEFLNDIDGSRVVYTSNRAGNFDIWMFSFEIEPPDCEQSDDLCADTTGFTSVFEATCARSTGRPETVTHAFSAAAGPAVLVVTNHGCAAAVGSLNGEPVLFPSDLNQQVTCFTRDVVLGADNALEIEVRSVPGCSLDFAILTEDECLEVAAAESCEASAFGGVPSAFCGLALLALVRLRRRAAR